MLPQSKSIGGSCFTRGSQKQGATTCRQVNHSSRNKTKMPIHFFASKLEVGLKSRLDRHYKGVGCSQVNLFSNLSSSDYKISDHHQYLSCILLSVVMTKVDGPVPLSLEGVASTLVSRPSTCHNICGQFRGTLHSTIGPHTFSHDSGTSSPQPGFSNLSSGGNFLSRTLGKNVKKCIAAYCISKTSEGINHR